MNIQKFLALSLLSIVVLACASDKDDEDDPSNPGNTGGKVTITGTSPEYVIWGETLTITGTGFSENKEENIIRFVNSYPKTPGLVLSSEGDIEILSATPTQLKIRVPYLSEEVSATTHFKGEDFAQIEVEVKAEKDTSELVKFVGLPWVGGFEYHYGWFDLGGVARSGDSVIIGGGFYGSGLGAGEKHPKAAGIYDKLRLKIGGKDVPIKFRKITNSIHGWAMFLPVNDFSEVNCTDGANGWNDREEIFTFYVQGTEIKNQRRLYITYLPKDDVDDKSGPNVVSKAAGGNPFWTVTGRNMYFTKALFKSECGSAQAEVLIANPGTFNSEYQITIPLSLMTEQCTYGIYIVTPCDESEFIGKVLINP